MAKNTISKKAQKMNETHVVVHEDIIDGDRQRVTEVFDLWGEANERIGALQDLGYLFVVFHDDAWFSCAVLVRGE